MKRVRVSAGALLTASLMACAPLADAIDAQLNRVEGTELSRPPPSHRELHATLFVADLHADTLMWRRNVLERGSWGHLDIPRMREGGVDLQVFTVVTKTPPERHQHEAVGRREHCVPAAGVNLTGVLSVIQGRPLATWGDLRERAFHQAARLDQAVARSLESGTEIVPIRSVHDLARLVRQERAGQNVVGAVLGLEGANWIGGSGVSMRQVRADVRGLYNAGFRSFALTHRFDNALAGSSEGCQRYGLTVQGEAALDEAQTLGMLVDLAHLSPAALRDVLPRLRRPPIVSHTGIQSGCDESDDSCYPPRNLSDGELIAIARRGGVIGIGFWPEAVGRGGMSAVLRSVKRAVTVLKAAGLDPWDHLAFGSDYDGSVKVAFDVTGFPALTHSLLVGEEGVRPIPADALPRIAGANVCRVLALGLPGGWAKAEDEICGPLRHLQR